MTNFHPAVPPSGSRRRVPTDTLRTPEEERRLRLGARRHACYTFVCFMLGLVWVAALAGIAQATWTFGWWGLAELAVPVMLTLLRYRITDRIFSFTIRNSRRPAVRNNDVEDGE